MTERMAVIGDFGNKAEAESMAQKVARYLPANYTCAAEFWLAWKVVITGTDNAGWTLDGYVIPRLQSGMIWASEVELGQPGCANERMFNQWRKDRSSE